MEWIVFQFFSMSPENHLEPVDTVLRGIWQEGLEPKFDHGKKKISQRKQSRGTGLEKIRGTGSILILEQE